MPSVVFVTAYDAYALRAFDVHAVDYLLKPYDDERFHRALERARRRLSPAAQPIPGEDRLRALVRDAVAAARAGEGTADAFDRIAVRVDGAVRIVRTADVDYFETDGNYVRMHV